MNVSEKYQSSFHSEQGVIIFFPQSGLGIEKDIWVEFENQISFGYERIDPIGQTNITIVY